jgi:LDH2 family malate/lactate/ureidoglycolate dehydrogenase
MAETKRGVRVGWEALREFCEEVLGAAGVPENDARIVAASLVDADLAGMKSHGVTRLNDYLLRMEQGLMTPQRG